MRLPTTFLLVIVGVTAMASTTIKWKPPVGAVYTFKWSAASDDFPGPNGGASIRQTETDIDTIMPAKSAGSTIVQVKISNVKAVMDGQAVPSKASSDIVETLTYKSNGLVVNRDTNAAADVDNPRIDNAERVVFPDHAVNVGEQWVYKEAADKVKGIYDSKTTYTFVGRDRVGDVPMLHLRMEYEELGTLISMHSAGDVWLTPEDGEVFKKDIQVENVTNGPGARSFKLHIVVEREVGSG